MTAARSGFRIRKKTGPEAEKAQTQLIGAWAFSFIENCVLCEIKILRRIL